MKKALLPVALLISSSSFCMNNNWLNVGYQASKTILYGTAIIITKGCTYLTNPELLPVLNTASKSIVSYQTNELVKSVLKK
jgi:hypothetical protein